MKVTHAQIVAAFTYDPETGVLTWRTRGDRSKTWNSRYAGKSVGNVCSKGYLKCGFEGQVFPVHRLVWWLMKGSNAAYGIRHVNGDRTDNRLCNLEIVEPGEEVRDFSKPHIDNKSGYLGVSWNSQNRRWRSQVSYRGKMYVLGHFDDPKVAHEVYVNAKRRLHEFGTL